MMKLTGKISDLIRSGKLPDDVQTSSKTARVEADDPPRASSVRHGSGRGLGKGAERARNGDKD